MTFYQYKGFCLCPAGGELPDGAVETGEPFAPLTFLVRRDPLTSRGYFAIRDFSELDEPEGPELLLPPRGTGRTDELARLVRERGAGVLNTAFSRCFDLLADYRDRRERPLRLNLVGLGDVGGTVLVGLKLLGTDLGSIGIFDPDEKKCARYEAELNQVLFVEDGEPLPKIELVSQAELFDCDALLFTASRGVPPVGTDQTDVRMVQYRANRAMLEAYALQARQSGFTGLFAQISDPVDQLSRAVFRMSNQNTSGAFDGRGLLPEQVCGFGLGVMHARALYCAERTGIDLENVCAFGPHGSGLVIANAPGEAYDDDVSKSLTEQTVTANLAIRALGYKPYLAPGLSSAAISVLRALRGRWYDAAVPADRVYFGCRTRWTENGPERFRRELNETLFSRVKESWDQLKAFDAVEDGAL